MNVKSLETMMIDFLQSFSVSTVFPAGVFILTNVYFILPFVFCLDMNAEANIFLVIACVLLLSYTFYAFNYPLIRFFEGYRFKYDKFFKKYFSFFLDGQIYDFKSLEEEQLELYKKRGMPFQKEDSCERVNVELSRLKTKLEFDYPPDIFGVLPTRLGNTIAAFESYSGNRYGMNSIALWPRLVPLLKEKKYIEAVSQEKNVFDFLMNMYCVMVILGLELFFICMFVGKFWLGVSLLLVTLIVLRILYEGMILAARQWGITVRVAFDLYRYLLYERLGLIETYTFKSEFDLWLSVSKVFACHGNYRESSIFKSSCKIIQNIK